MHPDPKAVPGLTCWAARPNTGDEFPASDPQDRIDLIYSGGPARAAASQLVGEPGACDVDLPVEPWPSDHRAVAVYRAPADPPTDEYLVWSYVNARIEGRLALDGSSQGAERWPLEPGDYEALLLLYDAYDVAARVPFRVAPGPAARAGAG